VRCDDLERDSSRIHGAKSRRRQHDILIVVALNATGDGDRSAIGAPVMFLPKARDAVWAAGPRVRPASGVVRPEGLEPPAYWFEASRSIQLSYGRLERIPFYRGRPGSTLW
jgi:hypothetical protein